MVRTHDISVDVICMEVLESANSCLEHLIITDHLL